MYTYALIQNGTVINIVLITADDFKDPTYIWVDITLVSPQPSIGWTYDGTIFTAPISPIPPLNIAIAQNIAAFEVALNSFIESRYTLSIRVNLIGIGINAQLNSLTNRLVYIASLLAWQNSIVVYAATYIATVSAMTDAASVVANTWNFTTLISSDPLVTAARALAINN